MVKQIMDNSYSIVIVGYNNIQKICLAHHNWYLPLAIQFYDCALSCMWPSKHLPIDPPIDKRRKCFHQTGQCAMRS